MKLLDNYLLRHFIKPFIFCLIFFIIFYIIIDLFDNLNEMIENHVDLRVLLPYYLNLSPLVFVQMAPIAVLIAIMYSLGIFNRHNEILAMKVSGISLLRILAPLIVAGFLISVSVFLVNDRVVPESTINASEIKEERIESVKIKKRLKKGDKILENIIFYGKGNRIVYARHFNVYKNKISELIIHGQDEHQNIVSKMTAQEAEWESNRWFAKNVMFFNLDKTGHIIGDAEFYEKKYIDMEETPLDFKKRRHHAHFMSFEFMSYAELKDYIERLSFEKGPSIRNLKIALNQKIAFPFVSLIVVLIASPFALVHTQKGGVFVGICISIALISGYYTVMTISLALGKAGFIHPVMAAWFTNIMFAFIGLFFTARNK